MYSCQTDLFADAAPVDEKELVLGGAIRLERAFCEADVDLMAAIEREMVFEERSIVLFGREVMQPRLIGWGGEPPYTYSGQTLEPRGLVSPVVDLMGQVNERLAKLAPDAPAFNHVLANLYRDGSDSMGLHSDDERELGEDPWIGSISLGGERCFQIAPKKKYRDRGALTEKLSVSLPHGSLLLMRPPMQRFYVHGLPKTKRDVGPRLNLTFRAIG